MLWDANAFSMSQHALIGDAARTGRVLLWNPWGDCGIPNYADPNNVAQSPVTIFLGLASNGTDRALVWFFLLSWLIGGLGMVFLADSLGSPPWGSFVTGCAFTFCGFFTGHAEHVPVIHAFAAMPWIIWRWTWP